MAFGAIITDAAGVPFYIDGTMPLTLIEKRVLTVGVGETNTVLFADDGVLRFVFTNSNAPQGTNETCEALLVSGGNWILRSVGAARTINVYIFGYQYQPIPAWGVQINDAQGRCILTNESKVLRDVQAYGNPADNLSSGMQINTTIAGTWAIAPMNTGYYTAVTNAGGQPQSIVRAYYASARYNGSTTQLTSGFIGNSGSGEQNQVLTNFRNRITAINVARY